MTNPHADHLRRRARHLLHVADMIDGTPALYLHECAREDTWRPMLLGSAFALSAIPLYFVLIPEVSSYREGSPGYLAAYQEKRKHYFDGLVQNAKVRALAKELGLL